MEKIFPQIPQELIGICSSIEKAGGRALLVGGCVRDALLGMNDQKDWDLEIYNLSEATLLRTLNSFGKVKSVGRSFGVLKLNTESGEDYDIAMPRTEIKTDQGHRGFEVTVDPYMSLDDAAQRRDFTFNAIYFDPLKAEILDPVAGVEALEERSLIPVGERFKEDPLRVLRGVQFAGRFGMKASAPLCRMAQEVHDSFHELAGERVWIEFEKWASMSASPKMGLAVLKATGWSRHFPEIHNLIGCFDNAENFHGNDLFEETGTCCGRLSALDGFQEASPERRTTLMMAMVGYHFGAPVLSQMREKRNGGPEDEYTRATASVAALGGFLDRMVAPKYVLEKSAPLVKELRTSDLLNSELTKERVQRLSLRVSPSSIEDLCLMMQACGGRTESSSKDYIRSIDALRDAARIMGVNETPPKSYVQGRDLIAVGVSPGLTMGNLLEKFYERQLGGEFENRESALDAVAREYGRD